MSGFSVEPGERTALDHVDGAEAVVVEIAGRADVGDDLARRVVDGQDGGRQPLARELRLLAQQASRAPTAHRGRASADASTLGGARRDLRLREMRCELGELAARVRHWPRPWRARPRPPRSRRRPHCASSTRSRARARRLGIAIRAPLFGRLRQRHQQRRLADRQPPRLLAEVGERRRAHAFEIAAERREPQIETQDLVLATAAASSCSAPAASGAACRRPCARGAPSQQARDLHGERRAARDDAAVAHELQGRRAAKAIGSTPWCA